MARSSHSDSATWVWPNQVTMDNSGTDGEDLPPATVEFLLGGGSGDFAVDAVDLGGFEQLRFVDGALVEAGGLLRLKVHVPQGPAQGGCGADERDYTVEVLFSSRLREPRSILDLERLHAVGVGQHGAQRARTAAAADQRDGARLEEGVEIADGQRKPTRNSVPRQFVAA